MFYRPKEGVLADVIPFYRDHKFYLFYLHDYRNIAEKGEGCPWYLLETKDFVKIKEKGQVLKRGNIDEQDLYVFTGSIIESKGRFYIFYTGHNPHFPEQGKNTEKIMLAESDDLLHWEKVKEFALSAPDWLEKDDFRDPFVYFDEQENRYCMLLAARKKVGAKGRRGCTVRAVSDDLYHWEMGREPFYAPDLYYTHECPDLFRMGDWWYLVFSEFSDKFCTHYRKSKSPNGPWKIPAVDTFDNRNFYAAKTVSDGKKRYIIGWNPTREENADYHPSQWGGNLVVHELKQDSNGDLFVKCPDAIKKSYKDLFHPVCLLKEGLCSFEDGVYDLHAEQMYASVLFEGNADHCRIEMEMGDFDTNGEFGILLKMDQAKEKGYLIKFEPCHNRVCMDRTLRPYGDMQYMVESERYCKLRKNNKILIMIDESILEVYINDKIALSGRMYDYKEGLFGLYCASGKVRFSNVRIYNKN